MLNSEQFFEILKKNKENTPDLIKNYQNVVKYFDENKEVILEKCCDKVLESSKQFSTHTFVAFEITSIPSKDTFMPGEKEKFDAVLEQYIITNFLEGNYLLPIFSHLRCHWKFQTIFLYFDWGKIS